MNAVDRWQELTVADVMSRNVVSVGASATMGEAAARLSNDKLSCLPVVDEQGHCVGILTVHDVVRFQAEQHSADGRWANEHRISKQRPSEPLRILPESGEGVGKYMSPAVQTVRSSAPLTRAAQMMCAAHIHHLLVLSERGAPVGVVTTLDIVASIVNAMAEFEPLGRKP